MTSLKCVPRYRTKKAFTDLIEGRKVVGLERRGPFLVMRLEGGDAMVIDLGPQASLQRATGRQAVTKSTQLVFTFTRAASCAWWIRRPTPSCSCCRWRSWRRRRDRRARHRPLEAAMSWETFGRLIWQRHAKLKALLMDRHVIVGIGPVYADEILFARACVTTETATS